MRRHTVGAALAMAACVAWWPSPVVRSAADQDVLVLVTLRDQPATQMALAETSQVTGALSPERQDAARAERSAQLMRRLARALPASQAGVAAHIASTGGQVVYAGRAFNAVAARVPLAAIDALRARPDVLAVEIDTPRHALLDVVSQSMLAQTFWSMGVTGGAVDVAVIDTGVYVDHEAFASRASLGPGCRLPPRRANTRRLLRRADRPGRLRRPRHLRGRHDLRSGQRRQHQSQRRRPRP